MLPLFIPMIVTEHVPDEESVQEAGTLAPPFPLVSDHVIDSPATGATKPDNVAVQIELEPTPVVGGVQETESVVGAGLIVRSTVFEETLPALFESPPYMALICEIPPDAPVRVMEHTPFDIVHVSEFMLAEPVPPTWYQATVPVGE